MTNKEKNPNAVYNHCRIDPVTGQKNWYVPLEILDDTSEKIARAGGLDVCWTRYGGRKIWAVMLPCKDKKTINGQEVYVDTPEEVQHERYKEFIREDMGRQYREKCDGRCEIPDGHGGVKRCPTRVPNPKYEPGVDDRKTLPVRCEGCKYEEFRKSHSEELFCDRQSEDEDGEVVYFDPAGGEKMMDSVFYDLWREEILDLVQKAKPKLVPAVEALLWEFKPGEVSGVINKNPNTVKSQLKKLRELLQEIRDNMVMP